MADGRALTSQELAELVVDALVDAGLVAKAQFDEAVHIAAIEIDVRKAMGDYSSSPSRSDYTGKHRDPAG